MFVVELHFKNPNIGGCLSCDGYASILFGVRW
jgi:hypothetical protein